MATIEQLSQALINADKAGDTQAAQAFAAEIQRQRASMSDTPDTGNPLAMPDYVNQQPDAGQTADMVRTQREARRSADQMEKSYHPGTFDDATNSAVMRGIPFADEIVGGIKSVPGAVSDWAKGDGFDVGKSYNRSVALERELQKRRDERSPAASLAGSILGGAGVMGATSKASLLNGAKNTLPSIMARGAGDGAIWGSIYGAGEGEGLPDRAKKALWGGALGGAVGGLLPPVLTTAAGAVKGVVRPIEAMFRPEKYANLALGKALERSGMTADQVAQAMREATADKQSMFAVADAMGHTGRRALTPAVRTPNNMRQEIADFLMGRQSSQGERLSSFLSDGFAAPDTAAARAAALKAARTANANTNYAAARNSAGAVDPSAAIRAADDFLTPGALPSSNIADDSVESAVRRARSYLTDGNSVLTDFNATLRAKQELDNMIEGAKPTVQRQLIPMRDKLDDALASASNKYAAARDTFRKDSKVMEAVDKGREAASSRTRAADNIPQFSAMSPEEQAAFRPGYVDPSIARVEAASSSPTTNKARMLMTEKTNQEFPAFAAPGQGDQMMRRLGREQTMFETGNAALGGSKTADNLADMEDASHFDPAVMGRLFRGDFLGAASQGAKQALQLGKGQPPRVLERVGKAMIETNPDAAAAVLGPAQAKRITNEQMRKLIYNMLIGTTGQQAGQNSGQIPLLR